MKMDFVRVGVLVACLIFLATPYAKAQGLLWVKPIVLTVFNNAMLLPGCDQLCLVGLTIHPGVSLGMEFPLNQNEKNHLLQTARLAYRYHRRMQHTVQIYTEFGYRRFLGQRWDFEARLGGGYLHAFTDGGVFVQDPNGQYEKKTNQGRPQAMFGLASGPGFRIAGTAEEPVRLLINYQICMQTPFVPGYVPLLPNTAMHFGVGF